MTTSMREAKVYLGLEEITPVCATAGEVIRSALGGAAPSGLVHDVAILIAAALDELGRIDAYRVEPLEAAHRQLRAAVDLMERQPSRLVENGVEWLHGVAHLSRRPDLRLDILAEHFAAAVEMPGSGFVDGEEACAAHYGGIIACDAFETMRSSDVEHRSGVVFDETEEFVVAVRLEVVGLPDERMKSVVPSYFLKFGRSVEQA